MNGQVDKLRHRESNIEVLKHTLFQNHPEWDMLRTVIQNTVIQNVSIVTVGLSLFNRKMGWKCRLLLSLARRINMTRLYNKIVFIYYYIGTQIRVDGTWAKA